MSNHAPAWSPAVSALCHAMSERESLAVPEYLMDEYSEAMAAMASEAVIYVEDSNVRFFHESFFDYFLRENVFSAKTAILLSGLHLMSSISSAGRRSGRCLRLCVAASPTDGATYAFLSGLLGRREIRFHIKKLVLNWLGALRIPTRRVAHCRSTHRRARRTRMERRTQLGALVRCAPRHGALGMLAER